MGGLLHLVQRGGDWEGWGLASPLLAVPNVTAHPSSASVPITVLPYDGPLLCGFDVAIKGLKDETQAVTQWVVETRLMCCSQTVAQTASTLQRCCLISRAQRWHRRRRRDQAAECWRHQAACDVWTPPTPLVRRALAADWRWHQPSRPCDAEERVLQAVPDRRHARPSGSRRCSGLGIGSPGRQCHLRSTQFGRPSASGTVARLQRRRGCWQSGAAAGRRRRARREHRDDGDGCDNARRDSRRETLAELCNDMRRLQHCRQIAKNGLCALRTTYF